MPMTPAERDVNPAAISSQFFILEFFPFRQKIQCGSVAFFKFAGPCFNQCSKPFVLIPFICMGFFNFHHGPDASGEFAFIDGFGKKGFSPDFQGAGPVFFIAFNGRNKDHWDIPQRFVGFQLCADFKPVHAGHYNIEQDYIRIFCGCQLNAADAVQGG